MANQHPRFFVPRPYVDEVQRSSPVTAALERKAERVLPRAQRLAYAANQPKFAESLRIRKGVRPGTRSPKGYKRQFVRVEATAGAAVEVEIGSRNQTRLSILRRSVSA